MAKIVVELGDGNVAALYIVADELVEPVVRYVRDAVQSFVVERERAKLLEEFDPELAKRVNALVVAEIEPASIALPEAKDTMRLGDGDA